MTRSKKKFSTNRYLRAERRKRVFVVLVVLVACAIVWGTFLFLSQLSPRKVAPRSIRDQADSMESEKTLDEKYQEMSAEELKSSITGLEQEAQSLITNGDYLAAAVRFEQALELQKFINRNHSQSSQNDFSHAIRLQLEINNAVAEPLFRKSLGFEEQADSLIQSGNMDLAAETLAQAIAVQRQLNNEYSDARQASPLRLRQLEGKLAELESSELHIRIESMAERAVLLKERGELELAGELFEAAALLQDQLNVDFPSSPHASLLQVGELRRQEQIARSTVFAKKISEESVRLEQLLMTGDISAAIQLLEELEQSLQVFEKSFPLSSLIDETTKLKITYLRRKEANLAIIQDQVYQELIPIADLEGVQMLRTEVQQSLYVLLIDSNPSRNPADSNPVDSVSWAEAVVFCERLGWILGREVRLPSEEEFRKALSGFDPSDLQDVAWGVGEANGFTHPVGQKKPLPSGFFDLLGNVSEWLLSEEISELDTAYHIGGHVQSSFSTLASVPLLKQRKSGRSRMTGFRFVVLH